MLNVDDSWGGLWEEWEEEDLDRRVLAEENWVKSEGEPCERCGSPSLRFRGGVCWRCAAYLEQRSEGDQLMRTLLRRVTKASSGSSR